MLRESDHNHLNYFDCMATNRTTLMLLIVLISHSNPANLSLNDAAGAAARAPDSSLQGLQVIEAITITSTGQALSWDPIKSVAIFV